MSEKKSKLRRALVDIRSENDAIALRRASRIQEQIDEIVRSLKDTPERGPFYSNRAMRRMNE